MKSRNSRLDEVLERVFPEEDEPQPADEPRPDEPPPPPPVKTHRPLPPPEKKVELPPMPKTHPKDWSASWLREAKDVRDALQRNDIVAPDTIRRLITAAITIIEADQPPDKHE